MPATKLCVTGAFRFGSIRFDDVTAVGLAGLKPLAEASELVRVDLVRPGRDGRRSRRPRDRSPTPAVELGLA